MSEENAGFLAEVPIFAGISEEMRRQVGAQATVVDLPAGEWLFRAGDPADALYVLRSGRLEVVAEREAGAETVLRVLQRGAVLGELALLTQSLRSASVRARRDSALLRLAREDFAALLADEPEFALALTRTLGQQLQESRALAVARAARPSLIAIAPVASGVDTAAVAGDLADVLGGWEAVAQLTGDEETTVTGYADLLDQTERGNDQVLLVAADPDPDHPWTAFCLRQADRVLALAPAAADPPAAGGPLAGCDLVLCDWSPGRGPAAPWLDALSPRAVHLLPEADDGRGLQRMARRVAGRSVGVVLSGGGARGLAHIGVLEELGTAGIEVDRVGGCSMGAFVGALFASGLRPDEMQERVRAEFIERNPLSDYTLPLAALVRGRKAEAMLQRTFGAAMIEELPREFFCVSCDLLSSALVVHRRGSLYEGVGASICLPGIGPPVSSDGRLLVDGGVLNNLPVEQMATRGEGPVIAVDVTARFEPPGMALSRRHRPRARRLATRARSAVVGWEHPLPRFQETLVRTVVLGSIDTAEAARRHADLTITPEVEEFGLLQFERVDGIRAAGREAARRALEDQPALAALRPRR